MKKKVLILSALLAVVLGAVSLQSCSSDDNYTTEEYGYYTEEEIDAIMALAKMYDLDIEISFNNYGKKKPLSDFEAKFQAMSQLKGRYEMIPINNGNERGTSICRKVDVPVSRSTTNALEKGSWSKSKIVGVQKTNKNGWTYYDNYNISVSIEWDFTTSEYGKQLSGSVEISDLSNVESELSVNLSGSEHICFSGKIQGDEEYETNNGYNSITYKFAIANGEVNRSTGMGDFVIN